MIRSFALVSVSVTALCSGARAACLAPASAAQLHLAVEDAEASYSQLDLEGFQLNMDEAAALFPCLDEPLPRPLAARYHRLQGLRALLVQDDTRALTAFLAARRIEPTYRFPLTLVPEDHPTRTAYMSLPLDAVQLAPSEAPPGGALLVDGRPEELRATNTPAALQLVDEGGAVRWSTYAWPGDPLPPWPEDLQQAREEAHPWRLPLLLGAAGCAVTSGTLYVLAASSHARWEDPATPAEDLDGLRGRTNGLFLGAVGAGGLALGTGLGAAWTFR